MFERKKVKIFKIFDFLTFEWRSGDWVSREIFFRHAFGNVLGVFCSNNLCFVFVFNQNNILICFVYHPRLNQHKFIILNTPKCRWENNWNFKTKFLKSENILPHCWTDLWHFKRHFSHYQATWFQPTNIFQIISLSNSNNLSFYSTISNGRGLLVINLNWTIITWTLWSDCNKSNDTRG